MINKVILGSLIAIFGLTKSIGQNLNLEYLTNWLAKCDSEYKPELVKAFFIDGKYIEMENISDFNLRLNKIQISDLNNIHYSPNADCNYQPGQGLIYITTKKQRSPNEIKERIKIIVEKYKVEKPKVLLLNNELQKDITLIELIKKIDQSKIYDISISQFPVPTEKYGTNAKNGIIKIWIN